MIRTASPADAAPIARIYEHYVNHTVITFETEPPSAAEIETRMAKVAGAGLPWLVAEEGGVIAGYAYATPWKDRAAYRRSVESTVYLDLAFGRRGLGSALYTRLFDELKTAGIHAVMGGIALPNDASVALHEKLGMTKVAHFSQVGYKLDRWVDVGYWQKVL